MIVLGISVGHDRGAVIIKDGKVLIGITQERISRVKNDGAYGNGKIPLESILYCMSEHNLTMSDIDLIVYSTTEILDTTYDQLNKLFHIPEKKLQFIPHHLAHAYSSFFSSGLDDAAVIVADASGSILNNMNKLSEWYPDKTTEGLNEGQDWTEGISIYYLDKQGWKEVYKKWVKYPVPINTDECTSVGTMYSEGSVQLVYEPSKGTWPAGKLMGLASYADQSIVNEAPLFAHYTDETKTDICIPNNTIYPKVKWSSDFFSKACVAGIYQREQERISLMLAEMAYKFTESKSVCTAGGSFLNCNSNEVIIKSGLFENCFFVPPADDSGIPLGCAWYAYQQVSDIEKTLPISPYFGRTYWDEEVETSIKNFPHLRIEKFDNFDELLLIITDRLVNNRVIGWFQGGSEIGPRALGNRSIVASPIPLWMKDHINHDIKAREWYRPFAPAVLYEHQSEVFDLDYYSPYMLVTSSVKEEWKNKIPAVVHVDGSSRFQSVTLNSNERFYKLIESFYKSTGVPVLLNTSFNGPHEPMVETPLDAISCMNQRNIDHLVIGNYIISRF
jgi:carbamoyltransferase